MKIDFRSLFESAPGLCLVLLPDLTMFKEKKIKLIKHLITGISVVFDYVWFLIDQYGCFAS